VAHVARTVAKIKKSLGAHAEEELCLGDWVEIRTRNGNFQWDGKRGAIASIQQHEITVLLDDEKQEYLMFHRDELARIPSPNEEINQQIGETFQCGDIVMIQCPRDAEIEQRLYNGCWGVVTEVRISLEVVSKGQRVWFLKSDVSLVDNPSSVLRDVAAKINALFSSENLDDLDRHILDFYVRRLRFSDKQLERLEYLGKVYQPLNSQNTNSIDRYYLSTIS
jgi:hypothetical protein